MKRFVGRLGVVVAVMAGCSLASAGDWVSMFNGNTLEGWTQKNGTATYVVQDGTILGTTNEGSPNSFMCSVKEYGDFELEFEVKVDNGLNSGVQIRSQTKDEAGKNSIYKTGRVNGPQVEIEASGAKGAEAGYVYGEATGRGLADSPGSAEASQALCRRRMEQVSHCGERPSHPDVHQRSDDRRSDGRCDL